MSIGKKIKFFRKRRGMTQRELGAEVGFPPTSADVRIAQYESGSRTPKPYVRNAIAEALGVSVPAFTDNLTLLHILFALEDRYGVKMSFDGETVYARLVVQAKKGDPLYPKLYFWQVMKRQLVTGEISQVEYDDWRYGLS